MFKRSVVLLLLLGVVWSQKAKVDELPLPMGEVTWVGTLAKSPYPVLDTNSVYPGSSSNLTRQVAVGTHFKGLLDDTIRVVTVQSGGTRYLVIATDTSTVGFGGNKFRIETPYQFPSGATEHAVCVGDVDGDEYTDILTGDNAAVNNKVWLRWFEWDPNVGNWVIRDSIGAGSSDYINNITIGDADNDGVARDILFNLANSTLSAFMVAKWNGTSFDTVRVTFAGRTQRYRAVAIGDVIPELPGNEVYTGGGTDFAVAYFNGTQWQTQVISTSLSYVYDIAIDDINPNMPGPEIYIVHGTTSYQLSVWYYSGGFYGYTYNIYSTWGTQGNNDIEIGDFLPEYPGKEVVLSNTGTTATHYSLFFTYSPSGRAYAGLLPKFGAAADYGVKIGEVNKFRPGNELLISCNGRIMEVEQRLFTNDLALIEGQKKGFIAHPNDYDTFRLLVVNPGQTPVSNFTVNYSYQNSSVTGSYNVSLPSPINPGNYTYVDVPVPMPGVVGIDTLYLALDNDDNPNNNTLKLYVEVWDDSTVTASSFSDPTFPPAGWQAIILSGSYNWQRFTSGTNPTVSPYDAPAMAGYRSYSATSGSGARLIAPVSVGPIARKVKLGFYMVHDNAYSTSPDSILVEYSLDGSNFVTLAGFARYDANASTPTWTYHEVEIGDFAGNTNLCVALRARSGYGNNMYVDRVRIFVTQTTAPANDAQILSVFVPKPVMQNEANHVSIVVKNSGIDPITTLNLYFTLGGSDTVWETWTGNLPGASSLNYTFSTPLTPSDTGEMTLFAGVKLQGDANPDNDTLSTSIHVWPYFQTLPYSENFDEPWENSTNPPYGGWRIIDGGDEPTPTVNTNDWHRYVSTTPSRTVARVYWSPVENQDDWLISPRLEIPGYGTYTLNFWHYYNDWSATSPDSGQVLISFDDGATWTEVVRYSNADDSGSKVIDITPFIAPQVGNAQYFRIAFHYGARNEFYWYVDDFNVTFAPDTLPPLVEPYRLPRNTYSVGPDTVIFRVSDISPFSVEVVAISSDTVVLDNTYDFGPGMDTVVVEIPPAPLGTLYDGYIYVVDANNNEWITQGSWWRLNAYNPGRLSVSAVTEPQKGVRLSWARPRQYLAYFGTPTYYFYGISPGDVITARFTPQYTPCRIDSVVALFYNTSGQMHLKIYEDNDGIPGNVIFDTVVTVSVYPTAFRIDLRNRNIMVNGEYHVGFEWITADVPYPLCDNGALTSRSLYYEAASNTWYTAGYDWIIASSVTYFPQSKAYAGGLHRLNIKKGLELKKVSIGNIAFKDVPSKRIDKYTVLRGEVSGGPYDSIGVTSDVVYDDTTCEDAMTYYYVVRMDYVHPDTMTYSQEVTITTDLIGPSFSGFAHQDSGTGNNWVKVDISDISGVAYDTLYYQVNYGNWAYAVHDSVVGNSYYYTIPNLPTGFHVELFFVAYDNSMWRNASRFPESGSISFDDVPVREQKPVVYSLDVKGGNIVTKGVELRYGLPERSEVEIAVYSVTGQRVAVVEKGVKDAGYYSVRWDGTDGSGKRVASGVYIVKMVTPKRVINQRVILTK